MNRYLETELADLVDKITSGVFQILDHTKTSFGTGFICEDFCVTCSHVLSNPTLADGLILRTFPRKSKFVEHSLTAEEFNALRKSSSSAQESDCAVLIIPKIQSGDYHKFEVDPPQIPRVGHRYGIIGFPFKSNSPVFHVVTASATFTETRNGCDVETIQFDGNAHGGNSGGPLFSLQDGKLVGFVTEGETGLSDHFENKNKDLHERAARYDKLCRDAESGCSVPGFAQDIACTILDLAWLASEVENASGTNIGFAHGIKHASNLWRVECSN